MHPYPSTIFEGAVIPFYNGMKEELCPLPTNAVLGFEKQGQDNVCREGAQFGDTPGTGSNAAGEKAAINANIKSHHS